MSGLSDSPASTQQNTLWKERFPRLFTDHPIPFRRQNNGDYRDKHPLAPHLDLGAGHHRACCPRRTWPNCRSFGPAHLETVKDWRIMEDVAFPFAPERWSVAPVATANQYFFSPRIARTVPTAISASRRADWLGSGSRQPHRMA